MYDVIYLCRCAVNDIIPEKKKIDQMNLVYLFSAAQKHSLSAIVAYSLEKAGIKDHNFQQAKAKSIRKVTVMEIDKELLFQRMETEGIWYMPLKGAVIKDFYPSLGTRQMSDFDILFDSKYARQVHDILLSLGFNCEHLGKSNHDVYFKQPVSNFEMHTSLFNKTHKSEIYNYYKSVKDRLIKDEDNDYGYHFSVDDLYIYLTAHEYKHFHKGGTGVRSLLDTYVIRKKFGDELNEEYIRTECLKLDISDFEQKNRQLAMKLFGKGTLTEKDKKILDYIIFSGTYGTLKNHLENNVKKYGGGKKAKLKVILRNLFFPMEFVEERYPIVYRHKILLPGLFLYRIVKAVTVKRKETWSKIKILNKIK